MGLYIVIRVKRLTGRLFSHESRLTYLCQTSGLSSTSWFSLRQPRNLRVHHLRTEDGQIGHAGKVCLPKVGKAEVAPAGGVRVRLLDARSIGGARRMGSLLVAGDAGLGWKLAEGSAGVVE